MALADAIWWNPLTMDTDQFEFFCDAEYEEMASLLKCEESCVTNDLHLVVWTGTHGTEAKILGTDARHVRQKQTTLSIPLEVVSLQLLKRLVRFEKVPQDSEAVRKLVAAGEERIRQWWERRGASPTQMSLELERDLGSAV